MGEGAKANSSRNDLRDYGIAILLAVIVALLIRFFLIEAYRIPSSSMRPTLEAGDTIFVAKWPFGLRWPWSDIAFIQGRSPRRGEVVIFSPPWDSKRDFVKRVLAIAGDTVEIRQGRLHLNGEDMSSSSDAHALCGEEKLEGKTFGVCWEPPVLEDFGPRKVPEGAVFVLGDLRSQSLETEQRGGWGFIPVSSLKARALWIWLSVEPSARGRSAWFSRIRFERMLRGIQ